MGTHPIFEYDFDCLTDKISIGQFRGIIRERGDADFEIPLDILAECLIGLVITAYGWTSELAAYQDISSDVTMQKKSIEALLYRPGFYTRVTRRWGYYDENEQ